MKSLEKRRNYKKLNSNLYIFKSLLKYYIRKLINYKIHRN